jgi:hypothetical protein
MNHVRPEFGYGFADGGVGQGQSELRIEHEGLAHHAHDALVLELGEAARGGNDEHLMPERGELPYRLAERGDNSVHFRDEGLSEQRNSHEQVKKISLQDCERAYHANAMSGR